MMTKEDLQSEIRYAIRLTQRTAQLYRHVQTVATVLFILGGSAAIATLTGDLPVWLKTTGAVLLAVAGAASVAIRPGDKAAQNEVDMRRYQELMAKSVTMNEVEIQKALEEARQSDAPEIDSLRDVAYNDVAMEQGRPDAVVPLTTAQRLLAALA